MDDRLFPVGPSIMSTISPLTLWKYRRGTSFVMPILGENSAARVPFQYASPSNGSVSRKWGQLRKDRVSGCQKCSIFWWQLWTLKGLFDVATIESIISCGHFRSTGFWATHRQKPVDLKRPHDTCTIKMSHTKVLKCVYSHNFDLLGKVEEY